MEREGYRMSSDKKPMDDKLPLCECGDCGVLFKKLCISDDECPECSSNYIFEYLDEHAALTATQDEIARLKAEIENVRWANTVLREARDVAQARIKELELILNPQTKENEK